MSSENSVASLQWIEIALSRLLSGLAPTRHMIDVGAHHGTSLEPFLHAGWKVDAFEPIETNRWQLTANFGAAPGLVIRPEAVSNETGTAAFHLALNLDGTLHEYHHSLEQIQDDAWHKKGPTVTVPTVRLDDLVTRGEIPTQVGFLKIDTEGHDLAVLQGASQLTCDVVSVEFWGDHHALGKSPSPVADMIELLHTRGYDSYIALCHDGDATAALYSTLEGIRTDSWGNIFFFNNAKANLFREVSEHPHWLLVLAMSAECDRLRSQLRDKEATIHGLDLAATERLKLVQQLHHAFANRRSPWQAVMHRIKQYIPGKAGRSKKDAA
jgi:FkbM family methyltransferase